MRGVIFVQKTPMANRPHIAVFGKRNAGKSSLINALTNQELAIVSEVPGTTADPVYKSMELLPLGPVVIIDTAGIDDTGSLGELRVKKTMEVIRKTDLAIVVVDPTKGVNSYEIDLIKKLKEYKTEIVVVINKIDLLISGTVDKIIKDNFKKDILNKIPDINNIKDKLGLEPVVVSASKSTGIEELRDSVVEKIPADNEEPSIIGDLIEPGEFVVLVVPIDSAAPKGRLILPQVQTLRDILDHGGMGIVCKETELEQTLVTLGKKPKIVVTDSQAFAMVNELVPEDILLTGFSVLFARYKGDLRLYIKGAKKLKKLKTGSKILIAEACTHRRQTDDIGTVKIPDWLRSKVGENLVFDHVAGREYPDNLKEYDLILHCGGCMLNRKEVLSRLQEADKAEIPVINYGMAIAQLHGILDRALQPFPETYEMWVEQSNAGDVAYG